MEKSLNFSLRFLYEPCISKTTIISRHSDWSGQLVSRIGFYREVYGAINILTDQFCIIDINSIDSNMSKGQCSSEDMWLWGASNSVSSKTSYGKSSQSFEAARIMFRSL